LTDYPGIDFKTSGFVVGAGSLHKSGKHYSGHGDLDDLTQAPEELLSMLRKPDSFRVEYRGHALDVSDGEVKNMLSYVSPDCSYEEWIRVGMGIHHNLNGTGFSVWREWSQHGEKYPGDDVLDRHWQSFGKSQNLVTLGTLMHYAQEGGYIAPVTFTAEEKPTVDGRPFPIDNVDLLRPPGLVGDMAKWIEKHCRFPRDRLAVAAALCALSNIAGLRYTDDKDGISLNMMALCVAGSGTGKEAVLQAMSAIHEALGLLLAMVGNVILETV